MIGFIGVGNMAGAIINGILKNNLYGESQIGLYDKYSAQMERFPGAVHYKTIGELVLAEEIIFLSVKPNNFDEVLTDIKNSLDDKSIPEKTFVSIGAGVSVDFIKKHLGKNSNVIRAMPNTPMLYGMGVCAVCRDSCKNFETVVNIFSVLGEVRIYEEKMMNAVISLTSSSPAYFFLMAKAMAQYAASCGFDKKDAAYLAACVMEGSAQMLKKDSRNAEELIKMVASPGGTTLAALEKMYEGDFENVIFKAMEACTKRAEELCK